MTDSKKDMGMIAGRRTMAEMGPASFAEVVADPIPARITANRKYPAMKKRAMYARVSGSIRSSAAFGIWSTIRGPMIATDAIHTVI